MRTDILEAEEWFPEWEGEQLEKYRQLRASLEKEVTLLRKIRSALDLSQVDTANILGVTQSNVSKIERGDPTLSVVKRIVEAKDRSAVLTILSPEGEPELVIHL